MTDAHTLPGYALLALSSLFVIIDPVACVPAFLAMTSNDTAEQRIRMAGLACFVAAGVLLVFALAGEIIFRLLGITMPAFQIAASVVLLVVALDMLRARRSRVQETQEETNAGTEKTDIAITPLAIPMLAGPGAISTAIVLQHQADNLAKQAALAGAIVVVSFGSYVTLRFAAQGARWLNPIALRIVTRVMGLLLAAVAMQFLSNGLKALKGELL